MHLRTGYLISGIITGVLLLGSFIWTLPDGRLHVVFCDVGQGDAAYVQFPDGRDMVIDGGPNNSVLECLGRHMPFWDHHIDIVALSHPQKDHLQGLIALTQRYSIGSIIRSNVFATDEAFSLFERRIIEKNIPTRFMSAGDHVRIGNTSLLFMWPSKEQLSRFESAAGAYKQTAMEQSDKQVLGVQSGDLNDYCLVFDLRYGSFDVLFPGDADSHVESQYTDHIQALNGIEVLKVPHHGSKTGMTKEFVEGARPKEAIISVGKNSYGHPSKESISLLEHIGAIIHRTDISGDIEIVSDGEQWFINDRSKK